MKSNEASVVLRFPPPTKQETERATEFWDRLHREERERKAIRQGTPEAWPFPDSAYDPGKTVGMARCPPGAWGAPAAPQTWLDVSAWTAAPVSPATVPPAGTWGPK